jgi:transcriptional regulator with XRE-family HTH domain
MRTAPGERLRQFREGEKLSMAKLAAMVRPKTSASHINKLEKGQIEFTMEWARRLGDSLGVHPLDFFDAMPKLPPQENAVIELYRGMSEQDRATWFRVGDAMAQRPPPSEQHVKKR